MYCESQSRAYALETIHDRHWTKDLGTEKKGKKGRSRIDRGSPAPLPNPVRVCPLYSKVAPLFWSPELFKSCTSVFSTPYSVLRILYWNNSWCSVCPFTRLFPLPWEIILQVSRQTSIDGLGSIFFCSPWVVKQSNDRHSSIMKWMTSTQKGHEANQRTELVMTLQSDWLRSIMYC